MQIHQRLIINRISCNKFMHCENTENVIIFPKLLTENDKGIMNHLK